MNSVTRDRQTKIVATLGPASNTEEMIRKLFMAGVDVFRLNFSHGEHKDHHDRVKMIRKVEEETGRPIAIIADMQGPKLRVGKFKDGKIELTVGQKLRLDLDSTPGDQTRVNLPHPEVINTMTIGSHILLDDGKVRMEIVDKGDGFLVGEIQAGRSLSNNKGFNIPGVVLPIAALTPKDRIDLEAALGMGVDWIAQSFVQKPEDVIEAKKLIAGRAALMIKIEKPSALNYLDQMIAQADGVMLARGDLGVEIPPEEVPIVQKKVVRAVRFAGKPIVVATQMLESMIENPAPTRAEANDVATAVFDGTDAVMLSAETAAGQYPLEAVQIMSRICTRVEKDELYRTLIDTDHPDARLNDASDAITVAADQVAKDIHAACIVTYTTSGGTALRAVRQRPAVRIVCMTQNLGTARRLTLSYGIHSLKIDNIATFGDAVQIAQKRLGEENLAQKGERFVMTAGVPFGTPGSTNVLRIAWVE
ncbi:MAG: pyruvate kinase [Alphaproteobacteria bacterium]|jgi:pyruvate kinase|nr:pyruvate kinase [Alphaproteobacteria bacterium]MCB1551163.1 pyruvate kinase [Alphaproteobacteria bacterium]MCB9985389.1 pyruvate kinase [Micavibrio sp.]HRK98167.1 pyruvate kinase [Alphaproteobacteria bacterium]